MEKVLEPLKINVHDTENATNLVSTILHQIEDKPLRSSEKRLLQSTIIEYFKAHDIKPDSKVAHQLALRISFDFLPGVSKLGFDFLPSDDQTTDISPSTVPEQSLEYGSNDADDNEETDAVISETSILHQTMEISRRPKYFSCTIQRHRSTLSTSYRVILEETKENLNCRSSALHHKIGIFGFRLPKSGMSNQFLVWPTLDSKQWKEKNAIGKLTKLSKTSYFGKGLGSFSGPAIAISVFSKGIDKLIHIKAAANADNSVIEDGVLMSALEEMINPSHQKVSTEPTIDNTELLRRNSDDGISNSKSAAVIRMLRSQLPRKEGSKGVHSLSFSKDTRIKAASRKNLVMECVGLVFYANHQEFASLIR
jgi:hypothetical protein